MRYVIWLSQRLGPKLTVVSANSALDAARLFLPTLAEGDLGPSEVPEGRRAFRQRFGDHAVLEAGTPRQVRALAMDYARERALAEWPEGLGHMPNLQPMLRWRYHSTSETAVRIWNPETYASDQFEVITARELRLIRELGVVCEEAEDD